MSKIIDKNKKHSESVLGYFAGIIDGEGSITITDSTHTQKRSFFTTSLGISSTDKILIDWIIKEFGGWQSEYTPKQTPKNSRKKVYRWQITGENLETILNLVYPYVVIKKREIEVMFKMRKTYNLVKGGSQKVPEEITKLRQKYTKELSSLHCRNYNNHKK